MTPEMSDAEIIAEIRRLNPASHAVQRIANHAERYLWLRDESQRAEGGTPVVVVIEGNGRAYGMDGSELDAAIDAAMKGGEA